MFNLFKKRGYYSYKQTKPIYFWSLETLEQIKDVAFDVLGLLSMLFLFWLGGFMLGTTMGSAFGPREALVRVAVMAMCLLSIRYSFRRMIKDDR
jgi:hypothetical protein